MGSLPHRHGPPSRRAHRLAFFCRPLHRHRRRRNLRNRKPCQNVPRSHSRGQIHCRRPTASREKAPPHHRGRCHHLSRRDYSWRSNRHRRGQHHRRQRFFDQQRAAEFFGRVRRL